jgi:C_GCAxxG_C_C family probable redox protein
MRSTTSQKDGVIDYRSTTEQAAVRVNFLRIANFWPIVQANRIDPTHSPETGWKYTMKKEAQAVELFTRKFSCSQSVFVAFCDPAVLDEQAAMKIATVFGSGSCGTGTGLCGAASGALLALSMKHGMKDLDDSDAKARTYALGQTFQKRFQEAMRASSCEAILGVNVNSPEYKQNAPALRAGRCTEAVGTAARILDEMLQESA